MRIAVAIVFLSFAWSSLPSFTCAWRFTEPRPHKGPTWVPGSARAGSAQKLADRRDAERAADVKALGELAAQLANRGVLASQRILPGVVDGEKFAGVGDEMAEGVGRRRVPA